MFEVFKYPCKIKIINSIFFLTILNSKRIGIDIFGIIIWGIDIVPSMIKNIILQSYSDCPLDLDSYQITP